jgi:hypothetical protein
MKGNTGQHHLYLLCNIIRMTISINSDMRNFKLTSFGLIIAAGALVVSCNQNPKASVTEENISALKVDSAKTGIVKLGGNLFSVPSPIQTALLIENSGVNYDANMLNSLERLSQYTSRESKALNLGVYGANLGYATVFGDNQHAIGYLNAIENLANDLEITGALDRNIVKRFAGNVGNRDSMLILTSNFFRAGDAYLKDSDREDVATLILAGGWIEAAYFTARAAQAGNEQARQRLAEQRLAMESLLVALDQQKENAFIRDLIEQMKPLQNFYSQVSYAYKYERPETYPDQKLTFINSSSSAKMSDDVLQGMMQAINNLRTKTSGV